MGEAEWAKESFMTVPQAGRRLFDELLDKYPDDGMICFRLLKRWSTWGNKEGC